MTERHKVFVSYHHDNDEGYRNRFDSLCEDVVVSRSVEEGDIDPNLNTETIRQRIRDEYLRDSSVTVVLVGTQTWQRKHVDWEIGSSLRDTEYNPRSGLLGILLPTYPGYQSRKYDPHTIPPRLYDNVECEYANLYLWTENEYTIQDWIHESYLTKRRLLPDNSYPTFRKNRAGAGWQ